MIVEGTKVAETMQLLKLEAENEQEAKELAFLFDVIKNSSPAFVLISRLTKMEEALKAAQDCSDHMKACLKCYVQINSGCLKGVELLVKATKLREEVLELPSMPEYKQ